MILDYLAFYIILSILLITVIASEIRQETALVAIGNVAIIVYDKLKDIFTKEDNLTIYPSGIGYDVNGVFLPYLVQEEFCDLKKIFDGFYLSEHNFDENLFSYIFKYAKITIEMTDVELYEYIDRKVSSILNRYTAKIAGCREIQNISSICINKGILTIYVARNEQGAEQNRLFSSQQYSNINEMQNERLKPKDSINSEWKDL